MIDERSWWILDGHEPRKGTFAEYAKWIKENPDGALVARTQVRADLLVSTVLLGADHNFFGEGPPIIFETMIFGGEHDSDCQRYSTYDEALTGHEEMVQVASEGLRT